MEGVVKRFLALVLKSTLIRRIQDLLCQSRSQRLQLSFLMAFAMCAEELSLSLWSKEETVPHPLVQFGQFLLARRDEVPLESEGCLALSVLTGNELATLARLNLLSFAVVALQGEALVKRLLKRFAVLLLSVPLGLTSSPITFSSHFRLNVWQTLASVEVQYQLRLGLSSRYYVQASGPTPVCVVVIFVSCRCTRRVVRL